MNIKPEIQEKIYALNEVADRLGTLLINNYSLSALYVDFSKISEIEKFHGKKVYLDVLRKIHEVIIDLKGKEIRRDDIVVSNAIDSPILSLKSFSP